MRNLRFHNRIIIWLCFALSIFTADIAAASSPSVLTVDYTERNPLSLVVKKYRWLEREFRADHLQIHWLYTPGSDVALSYLTSGALHVASCAALPSLCFRANGYPIRSVYVFTRADWAAIVVHRDSRINSLQELSGKRIAVEMGTDPYFFLIRALHEVHLQKSDVMIVPVQHVQGRTLMERGCVDAWAGRSPFLEMSQLECGSRVLYRNALLSTPGFLNVSEDFARRYPKAVSRVVKVYEKARLWALRHPDDFDNIYAEEARLSVQIARLVLSRYDFSDPVFTSNDIWQLKRAVPVLSEEKLIRQDADMDQVIDDLIDYRFVSGKRGSD